MVIQKAKKAKTPKHYRFGQNCRFDRQASTKDGPKEGADEGMELGKKSVVVMIDYATNNNVRSKNNSSGGKIMHYLFFPKSLVCSETFCLFCFPFVEPGLKVCPQKKDIRRMRC